MAADPSDADAAAAHPVALEPSNASPLTTHQQDSLGNFLRMSLLFSCNHGCVVTCLALATSRLGVTLGAAQSGTLYLVYTLSGLLGSTYCVKTLGSRDALTLGMAMYAAYVAGFWYAALANQDNTAVSRTTTLVVMLGGTMGGLGAGVLWVAQGSFFTTATHEYMGHHQRRRETANGFDREHGAAVTTLTSHWAALFAAIYLSLEVLLRALSTVLLRTVGLPWSSVVGLYAGLTVLSTVLLPCMVRRPHESEGASPREPSRNSPTLPPPSVLYQVTAAWRLLVDDPRMKYMSGLNIVFGLAAAFLNSYVNGEVVRAVVHDDEYVGLLTAGMVAWAALVSLLMGKLGDSVGTGVVLRLGCLCFGMVAMPFLLFPRVELWSWPMLVLVYLVHGTGRSIFEGTLKATFADVFSYEKEGAFGNIIFQNGASTALGYFMTFALQCSKEGPYCRRYKDGSLHDVLSFEMAVIVAAIAAIVGYWKASTIHQRMVDNFDPVDAVSLTESTGSLLSTAYSENVEGTPRPVQGSWSGEDPAMELGHSMSERSALT